MFWLGLFIGCWLGAFLLACGWVWWVYWCWARGGEVLTPHYGHVGEPFKPHDLSGKP